MSTPLLTIIIPVYNMEKYVERCIHSILTQSFTDFELIVIDDGSKDKSCEIISEIAKEDRRIKLHAYPNGGVSVARNRGMELAKGVYLMFIDADDYISDQYLEHIMSKVNEYKADIYIWGITKDLLNGLGKPIAPSLSGLYTKKNFLTEFVKDQYSTRKGLFGYISNKLLKTELLFSGNIRFDESMKLMEDYDFFLRYYEHCQSFYCFNEIGYHYVAYSSNSGKTKRSVNYLQLIDTHEKCINLLKENQAYTEQNETLLRKAIGDLSLSAFLESRNVTLTAIRELLFKLHQREYTISSLQSLKTNKKKLKHWIIKQKVYLIYFYLLIWNSYIKIKTK